LAGLAEAFDAIVAAIASALEDWATQGMPLSDVRSVVRGDRSRPMPALPAIWVVPEAATQEGGTFGDPETWVMPVTLAALVKSDDPETGGRECARLAADARKAVLSDRRLGLEYVVDTVSTTFDGAARSSERNRNLFWADATVRVRFGVEED
jgi:hypothetical protein